MAGNQLALTNVITVSLSETNLGVGNYNTSNTAIFTTEIPANTFGTLGYAAYVSPSDVATDFGSDSKTYEMANAIFSQQPNILAGNGQLIVILQTPESQTLTFSAVAASGVFVFNYAGGASASINWSDTAAQIQTKIRAVAGLEDALVTGTIAGLLLTVQFAGVYGNIALATITGDTLQTAGSASITVTPAQSIAGETIGAAITRTEDLVQYFGILSIHNLFEIGQTDLLAAAAVILPLNKMGFFVSYTQADITVGGMLDLLRTGSFINTRGLYYGDNSGTAAIVMAASYAGRALSTNFSGSNTTSTMHLKTLGGVQPDPTMTQTILNLAVAAGADTYVSLQGDSGTFTSGLNGGFFDQIYNSQWLKGAIQVAGYNFIAGSSTKIPQTESGMDGLKGAYRNVMNQAVTNGYLAPGTWNSSDTFGNPAQLIANVAQVGYYIFSLPVSQQSETERITRLAPLVQIAGKEAGAIQKDNVSIFINP